MNPPKGRMIWYFLWPHRWLYGAIFLLTLLTSLLESANLVALFPMFQALLGTPGPSVGRLSQLVAVTRWLPFQDPLVSAAILLIGVMTCKTALTLLREGLIAHAGGTVLYRLKRQLMARYAHSAYPFFLDAKQASLLYNCVTAPHRVATLLLRTPQLVAEFLKMVAIFAILCFAWPLATGVLIMVGLLYHGLTVMLSKRISYLTGRGRAEASLEQMAITNEFLTGIRHLMTYAVRQPWLTRFERTNRTYRDLYIKDAIWLAAPYHLMELVLVFLLVGFAIGWRIAGPGLLQAQLPAVGVFAMAVLRLFPSLTLSGRHRMEIAGTLADVELVHAALTAPMPERLDGSRVFESLRHGLVFDHVTFTYPNRQPLLSDLTMTFARGTVTAIVGASGAGKTTMVNLLLGLFEPTGGRILIDGIPLPEYRLDTWLGKIGLVSQDAFLLHASVHDNILFGRTGFAREDVIRAAQIARAHEFLMQLPQGYDTIVGDRGMKLSGGQQQRIAIARAVLADPEFLIFDEATSHLDLAAERQVQEAIDRLCKDRTAIVVAHRLSTIRQADQILVLEGGRIVEAGTHQALLTRQERYFHLVASARE